MSTAVQLLRQGRKNEIWTKYCGFLDLDPNEFMEIQGRLLMEQLNLIGDSEIARCLVGEAAPTSVEEFRQVVPITTYEDYEPFLAEQKADLLPEPPYLWAHTSGRSGRFKWIPYTKDGYDRLGERVLAGVILAAARWKGEVRIEENDTLVYNTPPRPYISGVALRAVADQFNFRFIPPLEETEVLTFQERIEKGFQTALVTGIDVLGSLSVVLVKMGERFAEGAQTTSVSAQMLHPKAAARLMRGLMRSRLQGRSMLPRDLWTVKALPSGGMDTSIYRDKIAYYWGIAPYEQYGSTEEGAIATQSWSKQGMTFFPDAAFLEFIPEEELARSRRTPTHIPRTVLMNEVEPGKRYEVVITNFFGKPLLRYRMHDIIEFTSLQDDETGIQLPQMEFVGRSGDLIDLAGWTGIIDEKMVWQAILNTELKYEEWSIRKENRDGKPILHLYIELLDPVDKETVWFQFNESLGELNPFYADFASTIEERPLEVTILPQGTFQAYMREKQAAGADLAHLKPPHMNTRDEEVQLLIKLAEQRDAYLSVN
jgi:hypothetical protein